MSRALHPPDVVPPQTTKNAYFLTFNAPLLLSLKHSTSIETHRPSLLFRPPETTTQIFLFRHKTKTCLFQLLFGSFCHVRLALSWIVFPYHSDVSSEYPSIQVSRFVKRYMQLYTSNISRYFVATVHTNARFFLLILTLKTFQVWCNGACWDAALISVSTSRHLFYFCRDPQTYDIRATPFHPYDDVNTRFQLFILLFLPL